MSEATPPPDGSGDSPTRGAARDYLARGWQPIPVPRREKAPNRSNWQRLRVPVEELPKYFPSGQENIGFLLGDPSGGLVDVDLDAPEAVAAAPVFLPPTARRHGRPGKPNSHWWYVSDPTPRPANWQDIDQAMLCELRSTGQQTIVPPSVHPSGEQLIWEEEGDPLHVSMEALQPAVAKVSACALIARHWPATGGRHEAALALAGLLLRGGLATDAVVTLVETAARLAGDEEWRHRGEDVRTTGRRLATGEPVTGAGTLSSLLRDGDAVLVRLRRWLGLRGGPANETQYYASADGLFWRRPTQGGTVPVRLTNFCARIVADVTEDDGVERSRQFEIEATFGESLARITVPAGQFFTMAWPIDLLGAGAVIYPGMNLRDHARTAVQVLSGTPVRRDTFTHLGWRCLNDGWVYLHAGGAIKGDGPVLGIEVHPPEALARFALPVPPRGAELVQAISASLRLVDLGPDRILIPLLAAMLRSVLGHADFSLHLTGPTGAGKTELAALVQQHFGKEMDARHLPGSWSSTGNALEGLAFAAKDVLLVVDDFAPTGATSDMQRYHREADRLLRAQGNHTGRQRMRADATLKPTKAPRGLIASTGEDIPRGLSLRARLLVIEVSPTDLEWDLLSECQTDGASGRYAQVVAAFVQWLAPRYEGLRQRLRAEAEKFRQLASRKEQHRRTAGIVAELAVGWRLFLEFAQATGAVAPEQSEELWRRGWTALGALATDQARHQRVSDPARLFLALLGGAVASGRAHVAGPDGQEPADIPQAWGWRLFTVGAGEHERQEWRFVGERVGWVVKDALYLDPQAAFAAAQRFGKDGGEQISVGLPTLTRRLKEQGLLSGREEYRGVLTVRRTLEGKRRDVLPLAAGALTPPEPDQPDHGPPTGDPGPTPSSGPPSAGSPDGEKDSTIVVGLVGSGTGEDARRADLTSGPVPGKSGHLAGEHHASGVDRSGWPTELLDRGSRCSQSFTPCSACGVGTFVSYGGVAFCRRCAISVSTTPLASNGRPKSPPESSGTTPSSVSEHPPQPEATAP
jgi:hypothetical protein